MKLIKNIIKFILNFFRTVFFLPCIFLYFIINCFKKIRFNEIAPNIGHTHYYKLYLVEKHNDFHKDFIDIFLFQQPSQSVGTFIYNRKKYNVFWSRILAREFFLLYFKNKYYLFLFNFLLHNIFKSLLFLKSIFNFEILYITTKTHPEVKSYFDNLSNQKDIDLYHSNKISFFTPDKIDLQYCKKLFSDLTDKIKINRPLITFQNRDNAYKELQYPKRNWTYHNYRNFSVYDYELAVTNMIKKDYFLMRAGNISLEKFNYNNTNFFDYSHSNFVSPYLDIYLIMQSEFLIGCGSGLSVIAKHFEKSTIDINWLHLKNITAFAKHYFFIPKKLFDLNQNRLLTFSEMLDINLKISKNKLAVGFYVLEEEYHDNNIKVIDNTPEEINDVFEEMHLYVNNQFELDQEDLKLQSEFWSKYKLKFKNINYARISPAFLKRHTDLLG